MSYLLYAYISIDPPSKTARLEMGDCDLGVCPGKSEGGGTRQETAAGSLWGQDGTEILHT